MLVIIILNPYQPESQQLSFHSSYVEVFRKKNRVILFIYKIYLLYHYVFYNIQNSMTPYTTATMPLGLGGGGASGGETLKPVIPPFLPQPSFELTAEAWGVPSQQKSQSTLDLTVVKLYSYFFS